ncbi:hypothetical protein tb265_46220 [Gemmatimonadetes bacterium T265]|nr:hypothetical protein tb265_46220 [Gemmatimonadetes bacterium T265]
MSSFAPHRRASTAALAAAGAALGLAAAGVAACTDSTAAFAPAARTVYGPAQALGLGSARTYAVLDASGAPTSIGVALTDSALAGLPATPMTGMPYAGVMLTLALPAEAVAAGYDHATLDWNPQGHDPVAVYGAPHFDFHFYTIPADQQMAITPADTAFATKLAKAPPAPYRPATYVQFPGGVPMMGSHWGDPASPELVPNAPSGTFTRTFLYGSYDGHFVFFEPMLTKASLEAARAQAAGEATRAIKVPTAYENPGAYPAHYTVAYDAAAKEYRVALDGLVRYN